VLKKGLFGGVLLALAGGAFLFTRKSVKVDPPHDGLVSLTPEQFAVISALAWRLLPKREGYPSVESVEVARGCDRIMAMLDVTAAEELRQLLVLLENGLANFLFGRRPTTFSTMSADDQDAVLREWQTSRITLRRSGYLALRGLVMAAYFASPATWPAVGYPGPLPGIHDPNAPEWKGGDMIRPVGNGTFREEGKPLMDGGLP
jgi:hypothetical protein